jgi:hypothetical protein
MAFSHKGEKRGLCKEWFREVGPHGDDEFKVRYTYNKLRRLCVSSSIGPS